MCPPEELHPSSGDGQTDVGGAVPSCDSESGSCLPSTSLPRLLLCPPLDFDFVDLNELALDPAAVSCFEHSGGVDPLSLDAPDTNDDCILDFQMMMGLLTVMALVSAHCPLTHSISIISCLLAFHLQVTPASMYKMLCLILLCRLSMAWIAFFAPLVSLALPTMTACMSCSLPLVLMPLSTPIWMVVLRPQHALMSTCSGTFVCIQSPCVFLPCMSLTLVPTI